MSTKPCLTAVSLTKTYGPTRALDGVSFNVEPGEVVAVTGPSGAGKTTICRLISGLEYADAGRILSGDEDITHRSPQLRNVAYMFESYALYPHFSVFENIASPLRSPRTHRRYDAEAIGRVVEEALTLTEMIGFGDRLPSELSGGQKQRVALCRTLVQEPTLYLLDEPISHLDAKLRHKLRGAVRRQLIATGLPSIWCTPDALEALSVGDKVVVLSEGEIQQMGTPEDVFLRPANTAVAKLIGDPSMNILPVRFNQELGEMRFHHDSGSIRVGNSQADILNNGLMGGDTLLGLRPAELFIQGADSWDGLKGLIYTVEPFGKYSIVTVDLGGDRLKIKTKEKVKSAIGDMVGVECSPSEIVIFDKNTGQAL
tara:strand:+ start:3201 stop:4310 length:1110 start_codon:yes stop_codon:yes gene_type:complete